MLLRTQDSATVFNLKNMTAITSSQEWKTRKGEDILLYTIEILSGGERYVVGSYTVRDDRNDVFVYLYSEIEKGKSLICISDIEDVVIGGYA